MHILTPCGYGGGRTAFPKRLLPSAAPLTAYGNSPDTFLTSACAVYYQWVEETDPALIYAQAVLALGNPADLLIGISTSGNAKNVVNAVNVAKGLGLATIALTGEGGGILQETADITVRVPANETYKIQELHLPVYHYLCAAVEAHFFEN